MFIKLVKGKTNKKTLVYLTESYRINSKKTAQRHLKCFGNLEDLEKDNPHILAELKEKAKTMSKKDITTLDIDFTAKNKGEHCIKNFGYFFLKAIYNELEINKFLEKNNKYKTDYDLNKVLELLVFSRILQPQSKSSTVKNKKVFFEDYDISLNDCYRSLNIINELKTSLEVHLDKKVVEKYGRDSTLNFYDVTNYYFEKPYEDIDTLKSDGTIEKEAIIKTGLGKDKKYDLPIVQMGLLIDNNGLPRTHKIFPGNKADITTLVESLEELKENFSSEKIILTADKGLNSGSNIAYLLDSNNGYIVSQKVRGSSKEFKEIVLNDEDYIYNQDKTFKSKSFIQTRTIKYNKKNTDGSEEKCSKEVTEKVVCLWSKNYDDRSKIERAKLEERIDNLVKQPTKLASMNKKGLKKYILQNEINKETGEVEHTKTIVKKNIKKLEEDSKFDGYYAIITSETELETSQVIEKYRGLWRIEESFKVIKSDFEARPIYLKNNDRIKAHFMVCFLSLLIIRILQLKTGFKYSSTQIIETLKEVNVSYLEKGIYSVIRNEKDIYLELEKIFNVNFDVDYIRTETINAKKREIT